MMSSFSLMIWYSILPLRKGYVAGVRLRIMGRWLLILRGFMGIPV